MNEIEMFLEIAVMGSALLILVMTLISYRLAKSSKLLILGGAFALFFFRGLFFLLGGSVGFLDNIPDRQCWLAVDFLILCLIYVAIVRKK